MTALVHGDLYAAHLLVGADGDPCGVIDWGDVHIGQPVVDLALLFSFLPPQGRRSFQQIYGEIDPTTAAVARFKALEIAVTLVLYGHDNEKADLVRDGQTALRLLLEE